MTDVVAVVADLIFATKITSTGKAVGTPVTIARSVDNLDDPRLILIDFDNDDLDVADAIGHVRRDHPDTRIIAFGSHVAADRIRVAREAGATEVLPRSVFVQRLPELLGS